MPPTDKQKELSKKIRETVPDIGVDIVLLEEARLADVDLLCGLTDIQLDVLFWEEKISKKVAEPLLEIFTQTPEELTEEARDYLTYSPARILLNFEEFEEIDEGRAPPEGSSLSPPPPTPPTKETAESPITKQTNSISKTKIPDIMTNHQELYAKLPEDIKEAIASVDSAETLKAITWEHHLHIDQAGKLADEVGKLMLGLTAPGDFIDMMRKNVGVDKNTAEKITKRVNEEVFMPVRDSLKEIHGLGEGGEKISSSESGPSGEKDETKPLSGDPYREKVGEGDV